MAKAMKLRYKAIISVVIGIVLTLLSSYLPWSTFRPFISVGGDFVVIGWPATFAAAYTPPNISVTGAYAWTPVWIGIIFDIFFWSAIIFVVIYLAGSLKKKTRVK